MPKRPKAKTSDVDLDFALVGKSSRRFVFRRETILAALSMLVPLLTAIYTSWSCLGNRFSVLNTAALALHAPFSMLYHLSPSKTTLAGDIFFIRSLIFAKGFSYNRQWIEEFGGDNNYLVWACLFCVVFGAVQIDLIRDWLNHDLNGVRMRDNATRACAVLLLACFFPLLCTLTHLTMLKVSFTCAYAIAFGIFLSEVGGRWNPLLWHCGLALPELFGHDMLCFA